MEGNSRAAETTIGEGEDMEQMEIEAESNSEEQVIRDSNPVLPLPDSNRDQLWQHRGQDRPMQDRGQGRPMQYRGQGRPMQYRNQDTVSQEEMHGGGHLASMQGQTQLQRSLQASKQMLFNVIGKTIGMIEQLEEYDEQNHGVDDTSGFKKKEKKSAKSKVEIPPQYGKNGKDLKAIVEGELLCLRVQMTAAPKEAVEEFVKEMVTNTLKWMAYRQDQGKSLARCDEYACAVIETLLTGQNKIKPDSVIQAEMTQGTMNQTMVNYTQEVEKGKQIDQEFKDEKKQAKAPELRQGSTSFLGASRVIEMRSDLKTLLIDWGLYNDQR